MLFKASEFKIGTDLTLTGNTEIFSAETIEEAVEKVLYTRQLKDGRSFVGPTGLVVYTGAFGWTVTRERA